MGIYDQHVLPRLIDGVCGGADLRPWRAQVAAGLAGRVVEIGFGSGHNVEHYPRAVDTVYAIEPSALARRLASRRIAASSAPVEQVGLDGQSLPLQAGAADAALSTFTLCSIPDVHLALAELRRVVVPGGRLHFLEHGLSPDAGIAAWQRRLEPLQRRLAGGCHLTRDVPVLISAAGFTIEHLEQRYARGPKPLAWFSIGTAINPGPPAVR